MFKQELEDKIDLLPEFTVEEHNVELNRMAHGPDKKTLELIPE